MEKRRIPEIMADLKKLGERFAALKCIGFAFTLQQRIAETKKLTKLLEELLEAGGSAMDLYV